MSHKKIALVITLTRGGEPAARLSFKIDPVHTAHVMLCLPYVLLFDISAY